MATTQNQKNAQEERNRPAMKKSYIPPKVEVQRILLEGTIAASAPKQAITVKDWEGDPNPSSNTSNDMWIPI
jgi:hypothetical protein